MTETDLNHVRFMALNKYLNTISSEDKVVAGTAFMAGFAAAHRAMAEHRYIYKKKISFFGIIYRFYLKFVNKAGDL